MTVSSTSNRVVYNGNASTTTFPFAFKVQSPADLVVLYTDTTGTDFTLSPSQYAATGFGVDAGGAVTYPVSGAPIALGTKLTLYRDVAVTQPAAISNQGAMWPSVIESALDRATYVLQKIADSVSRALVISPTDSDTLDPLPNITQRANSVLAFDASGQPYAAQLGGGLIAASSWLISNFFPATSASTARGAIGAAGPSDNNAFVGMNTHAGVESFQNAVNEASGGDVASAATVSIGTAVGNDLRVTGTTTIIAFDVMQAGVKRTVRFAGALLLTHNATKLNLPTGANITTAAGDTAEFISLGSGNWYCSRFSRISGAALASMVAAPIYVFTATNPAGTLALPIDNTVPQITEGNQLFSQAFAVNNPAHRIRLRCTGTLGAGSAESGAVALFIDGAANAVRSQFIRMPDALPIPFSLEWEGVLAGGSHTFSIRIGNNSGGSPIINGAAGLPYGGGTNGASLSIEELATP
jgi:hypothetical protein